MTIDRPTARQWVTATLIALVALGLCPYVYKYSDGQERPRLTVAMTQTVVAGQPPVAIDVHASKDSVIIPKLDNDLCTLMFADDHNSPTGITCDEQARGQQVTLFVTAGKKDHWEHEQVTTNIN